MCKRVYHNYTCGCREKGEFIQCDTKHNLGCLKCDKIEPEEKPSRNYCEQHLPSDGKARQRFVNREDVQEQGAEGEK